jgi:hypothetical protein
MRNRRQASLHSPAVAAMFSPRLVRSINYYTHTLTAGGALSASVSIVPVDARQAIVLPLGVQCNDNTANSVSFWAGAWLNDASTVTVQRASNAGASVIAFAVIEFVPGVIKSLQYGGGIYSASTPTQSYALSPSVDVSRTWLIHSYHAFDSAVQQAYYASTRIELASGSVTSRRQDGGFGFPTDRFTLVEFY